MPNEDEYRNPASDAEREASRGFIDIRELRVSGRFETEEEPPIEQDELPPEVKAYKNRIGLLLAVLGVLFFLALVVLSDAGMRLLPGLARHRELPPEYWKMRDGPGTSFPPKMLEILESGPPIDLVNAATPQQNAIYPHEVLLFLRSLVQDSEPSLALPRKHFSVERFLLEMEASKLGADINSMNRTYWRDWAKSYPCFLRLGTHNSVLGFSWINKNDAYFVLSTQGHSESDVRAVQVLYLHWDGARWQLYDARDLLDHASLAHQAAIQGQFAPAEIESLHLLDEELSVRCKNSQSAADIFEIQIRAAFESYLFPKPLRIDAELLYGHYLHQTGVSTELARLADERRTNAALRFALWGTQANQESNPARARSVAHGLVKRIAWHPSAALAFSTVLESPTDRALAVRLMRRNVVVNPSDLLSLKTYCRLSTQDFPKLFDELARSADAQLRASRLFESLETVLPEQVGQLRKLAAQRPGLGQIQF